MADGNGSGSTTVIALVVGALLVLVIGLYAGGVFTKRDTTSTQVTVETPPADGSMSTAPAEPSTTPPESQPREPTPPAEPAPESPTTTPTEPQPTEPAPATPPAQ